MMRFAALLLLCNLAYAGELQEKLLKELKAGSTNYSDIEIALIGEGVADAATLKSHVEAYEQLVDSRSLDAKAAKGKSKKKAKTLVKKLYDGIEKPAEDAYAGLVELLKDKTMGEVAAVYLLADLAARHKVSWADLAKAGKDMDAYFMDGSEHSLREIAAANMVARAAKLPDDRLAEAGDLLLISSLVAPKSTWGADTMDNALYRRCYDLFNGGELFAAGSYAMGSARYPDFYEFSGIAFNVGVKMLQEPPAGKEAEGMSLANRLIPFMGDHGEAFKQALGTKAYNNAAQLYNAKKYPEALAALKSGEVPTDHEGYDSLLKNAIIAVMLAKSDSGDLEGARAMLPELSKLDAARAKRLGTRFDQLELAELDKSGNYDAALSKAEQSLDSDVGRRNYVSVLIRYIHSIRDKGKFKEALSYLSNKVPDAAQADKEKNEMRNNIYAVWVAKYKQDDYKNLVPLYKRLFSDKELKLSQKNAQLHNTNYGIALYHQVTKLIEVHKFKEADKLSKFALKIDPKSKYLLDQRKTIDTILARSPD